MGGVALKRSSQERADKWGWHQVQEKFVKFVFRFW